MFIVGKGEMANEVFMLQKLEINEGVFFHLTKMWIYHALDYICQ